MIGEMLASACNQALNHQTHIGTKLSAIGLLILKNALVNNSTILLQKNVDAMKSHAQSDFIMTLTFAHADASRAFARATTSGMTNNVNANVLSQMFQHQQTLSSMLAAVLLSVVLL